MAWFIDGPIHLAFLIPISSACRKSIAAQVAQVPPQVGDALQLTSQVLSATTWMPLSHSCSRTSSNMVSDTAARTATAAAVATEAVVEATVVTVAVEVALAEAVSAEATGWAPSVMVSTRRTGVRTQHPRSL